MLEQRANSPYHVRRGTCVADDGSGGGFYWIRKLQARFLAGDHASAFDAAERAEKCLSTSASLSVFVLERADYHLYAALSRAACCEPMSSDPYAKLSQRSRHHRWMVKTRPSWTIWSRPVIHPPQASRILHIP